MNTNTALQKRINEIILELNISLTELALRSNLTPSVLFDLMYNRTKHFNIITIKKICFGCNLTLEKFFAKEYFNNFDDCL